MRVAWNRWDGAVVDRLKCTPHGGDSIPIGGSECRFRIRIRTQTQTQTRTRSHAGNSWQAVQCSQILLLWNTLECCLDMIFSNPPAITMLRSKVTYNFFQVNQLLLEFFKGS